LEVEAAFPHAFVTNTLMKMRCKSVVTKGGGRLLRTIGEVRHHTVIIIQSIASARIASCKCTRLTWRLGLFPASTAPHTHGWGGGGGSRPRRAVDGDYDGPLLAAVDVFTYPCRSCSSAHVFDFRWTMPIRSLAGLSAKLLAVQASCLQAKSARF
jgi:hypothetical protein